MEMLIFRDMCALIVYESVISIHAQILSDIGLHLFLYDHSNPLTFIHSSKKNHLTESDGDATECQLQLISS